MPKIINPNMTVVIEAPKLTETYAASTLFKTYAEPRIEKAGSDLGIEVDSKLVSSHIKRILDALHKIHVLGLRPEMVAEFEKEFGFIEANQLDLTKGTPLLLFPFRFLDGVDSATISVCKVTSNWQHSNFRADLGEVLHVDQVPIIGFSRSSIEGTSPLVIPPYNVQRSTSLYSNSTYASRQPWQ